MKKSAWISFCGYAALACASLWFGSFLLGLHANPGGQPHPTALAMVPFLLFWPCFALWLLGSAVYRVRLSGAKVQADVLMDAAKKAGITVPVIPGPEQGPRAAFGPRVVCAQCKREPALVQCLAHGVFLCSACSVAHDRDAHGGAWFAANAARR